jgi:ribosomal protein S18 acetylase RimI-like enzyme
MSSLPEGWRPLRPEDAPAAAALLDEDEVSVGFRSRLGEEDMVDMWAHTDLEHDSWLYEEADRIVAAGAGQLHAGTYFVRGCVRPGAKGRGHGSALLDISEERAQAHGVATMHQVTLGPDDAAKTLLESRGYKDVRRHYAMTIELADEPPEPALPEGFSVETFRNGDAQAWHAAMTEIFDEEWGFELEPFDEWWRRHAGDDHTLWFVVRDGGEIAALVQAEAERRGGGLVNWLGVRKPWQRQGLGRALLLHAFHELRRRGAARAGLGVDAENPAGATRLYESAGMHVEAEHVTFMKELA